MMKQRSWISLFCELVVADERDDLSKVDSDKFNAIINEVESLHQLGIYENSAQFSLLTATSTIKSLQICIEVIDLLFVVIQSVGFDSIFLVTEGKNSQISEYGLYTFYWLLSESETQLYFLKWIVLPNLLMCLCRTLSRATKLRVRFFQWRYGYQFVYISLEKSQYTICGSVEVYTWH